MEKERGETERARRRERGEREREGKRERGSASGGLEKGRENTVRGGQRVWEEMEERAKVVRGRLRGP